MPISYFEDISTFKLDTDRSTYLFRVLPSGYLEHVFYGAFIPDAGIPDFPPRLGNASFAANVPDGSGYNLDGMMLEYSGAGVGDYRTTALAIRGPGGTLATDPRYQSYEIRPGKPSIPGLPATYANDASECETLILTLLDGHTGARVTLYYSVFTAFNAIARSVRVENKSDGPFDIERVCSLCCDFPTCDYDLIYNSGLWAGERQICRAPLHPGSQGIASLRGSSSHNHNPFLLMAAHAATEDHGDAYGFSFVYSGNHEMMCQLDAHGFVRVTAGLNPDDFRWTLSPGETFYAPEAVSVYSGCGLGGVSRMYHKLYCRNLCRGSWKTSRRPVLINNWEATYFDFDEEKIYEIALGARELGIEMFVLDDGWFGRRNDDTSSLGDWTVNEDKLKGGLKPLVDRINALGMKFGIWFEPEMVSPDSDLYRAHPDWCIHVDGLGKSVGRNQYVLDMTRQDVRDNIFDQMSAVLSSANIEYVKWDFNRNITEAGSAALTPCEQGGFFHRYVLGVYALLERILTAFPNLLLEGCSGGGGRFDPGMLYYTPQIWTSDNTDAIERTYIQWGTSMVYPASSMSAHVSAVPNHQTGRVASIKTRGDIAMAGAFGYELDINRLTLEEREAVRRQVRDYIRFYDLINDGDLYRLLDPFSGREHAAWMYVSDDRKEAMLTYVQLRASMHARTIVRLLGLEPGFRYIDSETGAVIHGSTLMSAGIVLSGFRDYETVVRHFTALGK